IFAGNIDFTKRVIEVIRQRGYVSFRVPEVSRSYVLNESWSETETDTVSKTHAEQVSNTLAVVNNWSEQQAKSRSRGSDGGLLNETGSASGTRGGGETEQQGQVVGDTNGTSKSKAKLKGGGRS